MKFILEVKINGEGNKLAYLSPCSENGEPKSGYRIAGPKAWGGSRNIARLTFSEDDLITFITQYAPAIIGKLTNDRLLDAYRRKVG